MLSPIQLKLTRGGDHSLPRCDVCGSYLPEPMVVVKKATVVHVDGQYCPECDDFFDGRREAVEVAVQICRDCAAAIVERLS